MALENIKESVTLTADSIVEEQTVVVFTAHIPSNGIAGSITPQIRDIEAYNEHRSVVRQDQRDFQNAVWDKEDAMNGLV